MMFQCLILKLGVILCIAAQTIWGAICPKDCVCKSLNENDNSSLRVKCGGSSQTRIVNVKDLDFGEDFVKIIQLDLSKNQITELHHTEFTNFTNLKRLDLSSNLLTKIDENMFGKWLTNLERLRLSNNEIVHIFQGSFDGMPNLKQLNISGNPLACDCELLWLVSWSNSMNVKLQSSPKCEAPSTFKGSLLKKIKVGVDLHCESPLQPLLELKPDQDQLVFEGDVLTLRCRAPRVAVGTPRDSEDLNARSHVFWGWSDQIVEPNSTANISYRDPQVYFPSIEIDAKHLSDSGLLDSILKIPFITRNHTGMWDCRLRSHQANLSRTISVTVISDKTHYCPARYFHNNKGDYYWPRTIRNRLVRLPCAGEVATSSFAYYNCNENGEWDNLNTEACPYISETTRIMEQFAKVNLSIARGSVLESAKRLRNYTQSLDNLSNLRDPIDLVFISRTLTNYLDFVAQEKDLGPMLLDIVAQIILLSPNLTHPAELTENAATKFALAAENAAQYVQTSQAHKNNFAIEYFKIRTDSFNGMSCTWFRSDADLSQRVFQCNTAKSNQLLTFHEHHVEASIQLPAGLIHSQAGQQFSTQKMMVVVYKNSNFFPYFHNQSIYRVTSTVIGIKFTVKITEFNRNLSEPILIMLRVRPFHHKDSYPVPVWWNDESNSWSFNGCQTSYYLHGLLVFSCNRIGYYGLLQNKNYLNDFLDENAGARFRVSPVGFYIGSIVMVICAWVNVVSYLSHGSFIQMARRQRHALINTWLAISCLAIVFSVGIYQTEDYRVCQVIGILIHYFSLCVLLWVCVSVSNMYKRLSKANRAPVDEMPKEHLGRKPILGLYLVGWGIGLIICGISGAVNMTEYASYSYCFLRTGPALSAIFVPSTILLSFLAILMICVRCHIRSSDEQNGHLSEATQGTENVDLELLDSTVNGNNTVNPSDRYRSLTLSSPTTSTQDDLEHTSLSQLRAHFVFLFLYLATWASAAVSVVTPFEDHMLYEEEAFSVVYAIAASFLGLFILFYYSVSRSDVRLQWSLFRCRCRPRRCCRSRSVSDSKELNTVTYHQTSVTYNSASRSNSQCSKNRPPSATNHMKMTTSELNSAANLTRNDSPSKLLGATGGNMLLNRQQYVHNPVIMSQEIPNPAAFYNPNQINVARKFFKKQKRLAKRNNFELQRHLERGGGDFGDTGSDVSSSVCSYPRAGRGISIFSSGSKVNNTNIHVRGIPGDGGGHFSKDCRLQGLNPNILSDSCNESDLIVDAERLVLGAEGLRVLSNRNKVNNTEMVANIYTNVPETSQPQHEIVTMRADDKFRKSVNIDDLLEQDELDLERNDLNSQSDRTSTPLYVNGNIRNIMDENGQDLEQDAVACSSHLDFFNSPILAMNTCGLPTSAEVHSSDPNLSQSQEQLNSSSNDENILDLDRDEAYISEALHISSRGVQPADESMAIRIQVSQQKKSKSLMQLNLEINRKSSKATTPDKLNCCNADLQIRSISCNNLTSPLIDDVCCSVTMMPSSNRKSDKLLSSSPVLFSPSLAEINDTDEECNGGAAAIQNRSKTSGDGDKITPPGNEEDDATSQTNLIFSDDANSESLQLFSQSIRRNFSSSPTCESDLNYQNSELSIRSHGVYAPRPDNDLNITLTGEDHIYFPYQSSEISDVYDDMEDDFNNCSNDFLLPRDDANDPNGSNTSIDELYEQITRGSSTANGGGVGGCELLIPPPPISAACTSSVITDPKTIDETANENDDDSSQCSIISYIDPNEQASKSS